MDIKNSDNKLLNYILLGLILIIIGCLITYYIFNKDNKENRKNNENVVNNINSELANDVVLFASQAKNFSNNLKILAIKSNGEQKELLSSDKYDDSVRFKLVNDKIYFALFDTKKTSFGYIALTKGNDNYEPIILKDITDKRLDSLSFAALNNKIYYAYTNSNSKIYEYDIKTKKEKILISNLDGPVLYSIVDKNIILYNKAGNLYMLDISKNIETKLADDASISAIHNNKIIYCVYQIGDDAPMKYYVYDSDTKKTKSLFTADAFSLSVDQQLTIPYNNGYLYIDNNKIYSLDLDGKSSLIYKFNYPILNMEFLSANKLNVTLSSDDALQDVILDISNKKVINNENADEDYGYFYNYEYPNFK